MPRTLPAAPPPGSIDCEKTDQDAIVLMLTYVEAECRRLGADAAARHAALAAAMLPGLGAPMGARVH